MHSITRRQLIEGIGALSIVAACEARGRQGRIAAQPFAVDGIVPNERLTSRVCDPVWVYDSWTAYGDGLFGSDTPLTESLVMRELEEATRLKRSGVQLDYYMINVFWWAPDAAYRKFRGQDWPDGPDRWIEKCHNSGLKPGLWFGTNMLWKLEIAEQWRDSWASGQAKIGGFLESMSLHEGGYLLDLMDVVQHWYDRGIRLFEFDNANFDAATPISQAKMAREDIRDRNKRALIDALRNFRRHNQDAMVVAFNGFSQDRGFVQEQDDFATTELSYQHETPVDLRWLEVFDTMYCGDIRVSDVPQQNFWRSVDIYSDHMIRHFERSGVPLDRIDPVGFVIGKAKFGYERGARAWRSMLLLTVARGGRKKTIYGNLELLDASAARWFASVQALYAPLMTHGRTRTFGCMPGSGEPYGYCSTSEAGALYTVVNPSQAVRRVDLPIFGTQSIRSESRVLFSDAGFRPTLSGTSILLGPGQMALVGLGKYAAQEFDLGIESDVVIPLSIERIPASFVEVHRSQIQTTTTFPSDGALRLIFQHRSIGQAPQRSRPGKIEASQRHRDIPVDLDLNERRVDVNAWGEGISWAAAEIPRDAAVGGQPITIRFTAESDVTVALQGCAYAVRYD